MFFGNCCARLNISINTKIEFSKMARILKSSVETSKKALNVEKLQSLNLNSPSPPFVESASQTLQHKILYELNKQKCSKDIWVTRWYVYWSVDFVMVSIFRVIFISNFLALFYFSSNFMRNYLHNRERIVCERINLKLNKRTSKEQPFEIVQRMN